MLSAHSDSQPYHSMRWYIHYHLCEDERLYNGEARMQEQQRPIFSSRLGAFLTMVGVSVGLGNVWRFPYMMGQYGGSAFLLVYLACVLLLAVPALTAEWSLGRHTRRGPMGAYPQVFGPLWGRAAAILLLITVLVADAYYIVVIGQILISSIYVVTPGFSGNWDHYNQTIGSSTLQYAASFGILLASLWVLGMGVNRGIERVSRIFVPLFAIIMLYLVFSALNIDGATTHLIQFLQPDFAALRPKDWFAALGQAFFSLGLGGTFFVIYGSYLPADQTLTKPALATALGDTSAALLAGLFIVPTTLVFGLDLGQGPSLIFVTLPKLFLEMPAGQLLGFLFLFGLVTVAFLSNIAALEVAAAGLRDRPKKRPVWKVLLLIGIIEALLFIPITQDNDWIGTLDLIFGSGMQVAGSLLAIVAVGWCIQKAQVQQQVFGKESTIGAIYLLWLRWLIPLVLFAILLSYILSNVS